METVTPGVVVVGEFDGPFVCGLYPMIITFKAIHPNQLPSLTIKWFDFSPFLALFSSFF